MILKKDVRFEKPQTSESRYYVNNKKLKELLDDYKTTGKISDELGKCFLLIAKKLATAANFRGYTYVDDFVQEGVECCLKYIHNYNPEKGSNPFGYFTQIMKFAFINKIKQENNYQKVKRKAQEYDEEGYLIESNTVNKDFILDNPFSKEEKDILNIPEEVLVITEEDNSFY